MIQQITNQFFNSFLAFNAIGFGINFMWAFSQNIDLFSRSLFFSGFNLCILLSDLIYLSTIIVNAKILTICRKHQLKTIEEKNREDLEEHNKALGEQVDKELDKNCAKNCEDNSEESTEETIKHNTKESSSDCDSDSSSEDEVELKIKNFATHRVASIGVKQFDDVLSPEEYEKLNFDSL